MKFIDLGLPSGTLWADCNLGADKIESFGNYYTWGDLDLNEVPTLDEIKELCNKCSWERTSVNGVNGQKVTGPNGNSIFLPAAGYRYDTSLYSAGSYGYYWSATPYSNSNNAYGLYFSSDGYDWGYHNRYYGFAVRLIKHKNNLKINKNMKPITPQQVKKEFELPDVAITVINKMITQHFTGSESIFTKEQLSYALLETGYNNKTIESMFKQIPRIYTQSGWNVETTDVGFIFQELMN